MARVRTGLEVLVEQEMPIVRGKRVGLVTNHSAVNCNLVHSIEILRGSGVNLAVLFGPEHGIRGDMPHGTPVPSSTDLVTGLPVFSLYGKHRKPTRDMMSGLEVVLFDIQDVGCRYYTYIYTMAYVMQACAEYGKQFVVLDRPNPINGRTVEGNILDLKFASFVGLYPIAIRYGLTPGELATFMNVEFGIECALHVVRCTGWKRATWFDETGLPWVPPSPNMPTLETATLYPGLCLLEGTNVSEGRGTSKPFEVFGAPWVDAFKLADYLNSLNLPGIRLRPAYFIPTASKYQGQRCEGVQAHITHRDSLRPTLLGLYAVKALYDLYPNEFQFLPPGRSGKHLFDLLVGTDKTRLAIQVGAPVDEITDEWYERLPAFIQQRQRYLIYL